MKSLCDHELNPMERYICKSHQLMWDLCVNSMGIINPLANSLLDWARKCFQTLKLGYQYYSAVEKITRMTPTLSSTNNSQELEWTKDHSQKSSTDATTLFWKPRQFKTTKMRQLASLIWDDHYDHFLNRADIAVAFLADFLLRNMKKFRTLDIKIHCVKTPLHAWVGMMEDLLKHGEACI